MKARLRARLSFANVTSLLALFVALGGSAYAAGVLPAGSVGTAQLKKDAVTSAKVKDGTLKAADFASGQLKAGPRGDDGPRGAAGPAGPAGTIDASLYYSKLQSDARYLRTSAVITVASATTTVGAGSYTSERATCPGGYAAISGGVATSSGQNVVVGASSPVVDGLPAFGLSAGTHGIPTAWDGYVRNNGGVGESFTVVAICAPVG